MELQIRQGKSVILILLYELMFTKINIIKLTTYAVFKHIEFVYKRSGALLKPLKGKRT
jgi:hypothetical protein